MKRQGPLILPRSQDSLAAMGRPSTGLNKRPPKDHATNCQSSAIKCCTLRRNCRYRLGVEILFTYRFRMFLIFRLFLLASFFALPNWSVAQQSSEAPLEIGDSGAAYLKAIRFRRIDVDVAYFDPTRPPPPMEAGQEPTAPAERTDVSGEWAMGDLSFPGLVISAAVLLLIVYVFARFGGNVTVSMGRDAENATRQRGKTPFDNRGSTHPVPGNLASILRLQDRREALVQLAQAALAAAISANGVLLQRSWTAREALRHLPADQSHLSALRSLVLASERVHFGGRDVSEEEFQSHVDEIRPLLQAGVSA